MKILGYILLLVALIGGGVSGFLWRHHIKQAREAAAQEQGALATANDWETSEAIQLRNDESRLSTDELALHNDNLEEQIAELEGHSTAPARARAAKDESLINADQMVLRLTEDSRAFGPSKHVRDAQEAAAAAHAQLAIATTWASRDERFVYFSAGLLVLAGFAFGFATKQRPQTVGVLR
jgi:hypothetical protein